MEEHNNMPPQQQAAPATNMQGAAPAGGQPTPMGNMGAGAPTPAPKKSGGMGPVVGIIVIIAVLAIGGLYFWGAQLQEQSQQDAKDAMMMFDESANDDIANTSDEPEAIEDDLDDFDSVMFDAELEADLEAMEGAL